MGGVATFWKTSGRVLCVGGESLPLGIFQKVQIERQMCQIRPGDLLVMMTDGVLDMMEDGEERMAQVLEGLQEQNPQEIAEHHKSHQILYLLPAQLNFPRVLIYFRKWCKEFP